jgi:hypothetical protein
MKGCPCDTSRLDCRIAIILTYDCVLMDSLLNCFFPKRGGREYPAVAYPHARAPGLVVQRQAQAELEGPVEGRRAGEVDDASVWQSSHQPLEVCGGSQEERASELWPTITRARWPTYLCTRWPNYMADPCMPARSAGPSG